MRCCSCCYCWEFRSQRASTSTQRIDESEDKRNEPKGRNLANYSFFIHSFIHSFIHLFAKRHVNNRRIQTKWQSWLKSPSTSFQCLCVPFYRMIDVFYIHLDPVFQRHECSFSWIHESSTLPNQTKSSWQAFIIRWSSKIHIDSHRQHWSQTNNWDSSWQP
jgi:hypothetical protein